ncbi:MAG: histidine phosphatase family protein [Dehalococcoidia bacterium]|nr:histidine phosphatase family protein [Dehalococcoidia bacterium]
MELCLVRHGVAAERGPAYPDDALRPLTGKGKERLREAAPGLALLFAPDVIVTSPYRRARETAEILADAYGTRAVQTSGALAGDDYEGLFSELAGLDADRVLAIGHEPYLSETLSVLLTGDAAAVGIDFKKGAAAMMDCQGLPVAGRATLAWFLPPAALRAIGHRALREGH